MDRCNMISDMLRFLRIGFLLRKEFDLEMPLPEGVPLGCIDRLEPLCRGPYSQVTSQSLSLGTISVTREDGQDGH